MDGLARRVARPPDDADFDFEERRYLLDRLVLVTSRHDAAEEMTFWPHVRRRLVDGDRLAERAVQAEDEIKGCLSVMGVTRAEDELVAEAGRLRTLLGEHIHFEETTVFPAMHRCTTQVWRVLTGYKFRLAARAAPTRPHPDGPVTLAGFMTVGAASIVVDHLRDRRDAARRRPDGFESTGHPDVIEVIEAEHRRIRDLLERIDAQADPDATLVHHAIRQLSIHDSIERQYLYPVVRRRVEDGNQVYSQLIAEHGAIAQRAANLEAYRFHDDSRISWLRELAAMSRRHMDEEEETVLPRLRARLTTEELIHLGGQVAAARDRAPTRPHPHVAGAGAGARVSSRLAAPLDKARDALSGRS